jgi:Uma2 family endonuclease
MYQTDPPLPPKETLPTMYDLPSEDPQEPGVPDEFHLHQPRLLQETFHPPNYPADQVFTASDLNLYYDIRHPLWYKRPDWFAVVDVSRLHENRDLRLSYVIWQEGVVPVVVIELLSPGTENEDLGQTMRDVNSPPTKWQVYEQILRIPYYAVFNRYTNQLRIFQLTGRHYQELSLEGGRLWIPDLQLGLGLWQGRYQEIERLWLRWFDGNGDWIATPVEAERSRAEAERSRAEAERSRAEAERSRADRLAERLRNMGIDPDQV